MRCNSFAVLSLAGAGPLILKNGGRGGFCHEFMRLDNAAIAPDFKLREEVPDFDGLRSGSLHKNYS
jgi:hypothetical protein